MMLQNTSTTGTRTLGLVMLILLLILGLCDRGVGGEAGEVHTRRVRHKRNTNRSISANLINTQLEREFSRNVNLVNSASWRCGVPKPRLVYLTEAIETVPVVPPDTAWVVDVTVLHRCEAALGCCNHPKECKPVSMEPVTVTFKTVNKTSGAPAYHRIPFSNHTLCSCLTT